MASNYSYTNTCMYSISASSCFLNIDSVQAKNQQHHTSQVQEQLRIKWRMLAAR
jgi:hypothetical protein